MFEVKREVTDNRSVGFWRKGEGGLTRMSATLMFTDARVLEARLDAMAATVCDADARSEDARRVDALGAWGLGINGCRASAAGLTAQREGGFRVRLR